MHNEVVGHEMVKIKFFKNEKIFRIIPSRYPPVDLFTRIAVKEDWNILNDLASLTNDRLRNEEGQIEIIAKEEQVYGAGANYIMAPFTHLNPEGSRFSDGTYGVYYAADTIDCAIAETTYHRARFLMFTNTPPIDLEMRVLLAELTGPLHNIAALREKLPEIYSLNDYQASKQFAKRLRTEGSAGIYYSSVRASRGYCYAIFKPKLISKCRQERHLIYRWNGKRIESVFEMKQRKI